MTTETDARLVAALKWKRPLHSRTGASERLCGIRVFHDFSWLDVFGDERTQFKHGKDLARTVIGECPTTHIPALLLTRRSDVDEGFLLTETHLLFVVNIDDYRRSQTNPALSYLASHLRVDVAQLHGYTGLADLGAPEQLRRAINEHLGVEDVAAWLKAEPERWERLLEVLDRTNERPDGPQDPLDHKAAESPGHRLAAAQQALDSLTAIGHLSDDQIVQLIDLVTQLTKEEGRADLLRGATRDETGRRAATCVIHERTADRIADAEAALDEYGELLLGGHTTETQMQAFLAKNPLIFGLQYANIRAQVEGPSGTMDFLLERLDGYNDLVELKGPHEKLIIAPSHEPGTTLPSPHTYRLSKALGQALAQALAYRERLTRFPDVSEAVHGIPNPRYPRLVIVLGRTESLDPHKKDVLDELNLSLHRTQIVGYDALALQARATLANLRAYLAGSPTPPQS
ncbi:MAG TPA: Shedu anti-phage system protein SduA domain-containing protein [Propionicimonas sp.]|jgi:hypothetical protein